MQKQSKMRRKRIRNLIVIFSLTAVILSVSTYAWFIGMRTVNVSSFDVEIASTDSLLLSLNGQTWDTTVQISQATVDSNSYVGNTNSWGGAGLFPISSIGTMDVDASRMQLFEKASLTTTPGGYRLMASRVDNYNIATTGEFEQDGYVAFDLFVKNFSGTQYLEALDQLDEEAIYLTTDSAVKVADVGSGGVANTGIENSVRVAFAQIGRVAGTTNDVAKITGINCNADAESKPSIVNGVTGICRTAQIWEPNDTKHVANAISWYTTSCKGRKAAPDGNNVTSDLSYTGVCGTIAEPNAYPTYAVSTDITSADNVDVYDGAEYNGFTTSAKLTAYPYFTDTMKDYTGTARPTFMSLSPNSITKIRIYIYIEGQDIDNYDFASIGKKISINFGFTKERYTEDDIDYNGPTIPDTERPVISLNGSDPMTLAVGGTYVEPGATANDNIDGVIAPASIVTTGTVDTGVAGTYTITYTVTDAAGNTGTKTRTVIVK